MKVRQKVKFGRLPIKTRHRIIAILESLITDKNCVKFIIGILERVPYKQKSLMSVSLISEYFSTIDVENHQNHLTPSLMQKFLLFESLISEVDCIKG